MLIIETKWIKV